LQAEKLYSVVTKWRPTRNEKKTTTI